MSGPARPAHVTLGKDMERERYKLAQSKLQESMEGYDPTEPPPVAASGFLTGSPASSPPIASPATESLLERRWIPQAYK